MGRPQQPDPGMSTDLMNTPMLADRTYDENVLNTTAIGR
jgi:hypothetical protein